MFPLRPQAELPTPPVASSGPGVGPGYNATGHGDINKAPDHDEHPSSALERELAGEVGR